MCSAFLPINGALSACPPMLPRAEVFPLWTLPLVIDWSLASSPHTYPYQSYSSGDRTQFLQGDLLLAPSGSVNQKKAFAHNLHEKYVQKAEFLTAFKVNYFSFNHLVL